MGIILAIIGGLIVGALGRLILPGKQNISILMTIVVGVLASLVAGVVLSLFGYGNDNGGIPWLSLVVGALVAAGGIVAYGNLTGKRA